MLPVARVVSALPRFSSHLRRFRSLAPAAALSRSVPAVSGVARSFRPVSNGVRCFSTSSSSASSTPEATNTQRKTYLHSMIMSRKLPPSNAVVAQRDDIAHLLPCMHDLSVTGKLDPRQFVVRYVPPSSPESPPFTFRTSTDSWLEFTYPFSTDHRMRDQYLRMDSDQLRFGKILEDMDAFAADVAYRFAEGPRMPGADHKFTIVTACVDRLDFFAKLHADRDLRLQGYVTWVGRSSMEVRVDVISVKPGCTPSASSPSSCSSSYSRHTPYARAVFQELSPSQTYDAEDEIIGQALFVMVARGAHKDVAITVPSLDVKREPEAEEKERAGLRNEIGKQNHVRRKENITNSLYVSTPTKEEVDVMHSLYLEARNHPVPIPNSEYAVIEETKCERSSLMHQQERNIHGKIFGGHLMREAFELGWLTAYLHTGIRPDIIFCDDINFIKPVNIGSLLRFNGRVVHVGGSSVQVHVEAESMSPANRVASKTNEFRFVFRCAPESGGKLRKIMPKSYEEFVLYLQAKRHRDQVVEEYGVEDF